MIRDDMRDTLRKAAPPANGNPHDAWVQETLIDLRVETAVLRSEFGKIHTPENCPTTISMRWVCAIGGSLLTASLVVAGWLFVQVWALSGRAPAEDRPHVTMKAP